MTVKLTRAERTQVRRATTRMMTIEKREFPSSSSSAVYVARIMLDGKFQCDCRGWVIKKVGKARWCKHCTELCAGRPVITNNEYVFLIEAARAYLNAQLHGEEREGVQ